MKNQNAEKLLATVMQWTDQETVLKYVPQLQLLADYKYDGYQRFGPGKRFVESLALWLRQFDIQHRQIALDFVLDRLIFISDAEFSHLVATAYPDVIVQDRMRLVAEESGIPGYCVGRICSHPRFVELKQRSLYLGLSDGARTDELRRSSNLEIGNEQIWHAYELGEDKAKDMIAELRTSLRKSGQANAEGHFNVVWLIDDFSGSGNTYIRYDSAARRFKGKIPKIYTLLHALELIETAHYEICLLLYSATRQAVDHIQYWTERFTSDHGYKPLQIKVLSLLDEHIAVTTANARDMTALISDDRYYDASAFDKNIAVGGTTDAKRGFAGCALPLVLSHNTPNNSIYVLWGPETLTFQGLFPRVSRHREF